MDYHCPPVRLEELAGRVCHMNRGKHKTVVLKSKIGIVLIDLFALSTAH